MLSRLLPASPVRRRACTALAALGLVVALAVPAAHAQTLGWGVVPQVSDAETDEHVVLLETNAGVAIRDGVVQPLYDGAPAPEARVTYFGDAFRVSSPGGEVLAEVSIRRSGDDVVLDWIWLPRPYLSAEIAEIGVTVRGLSDAEADAAGDGLGDRRAGAVVVTKVAPGSPAASASVQRGDVLTGVKTSGQSLNPATPLHLLTAARSAPAGETSGDLVVRLLRDGQPLTRTLRVGGV